MTNQPAVRRRGCAWHANGAEARRSRPTTRADGPVLKADDG